MGRGMLLAALATMWAGTAVPAAAAASAPDEPVDAAEAIPASIDGFELAEERAAELDSVVRVFERPGAELTIWAIPVTTPPGTRSVFRLVEGIVVGTEPVDEPAFELASWLEPGDQPSPAGSDPVLVLGAADVIFITWLLQEPPSLDARALLRGLAPELLALGGGEPPPARVREVDDGEAVAYLPTEPPPGFGLEGPGLTVTGEDEMVAAGEVRSDVLEFLERRSTHALRLWGDDRLRLAVDVTEYPYDEFAAAVVAEDFDGLQPIELPPDAVRDAAAWGDADGVNVLLRRGDVAALIRVDYTSPADRDLALQLALATAASTEARLPDGASAPQPLPGTMSKLTGLVGTAVIVTLVAAGAWGVALLRARRVRRRWRHDPEHVELPPPSPGETADVVHLDVDARALRRRGTVVRLVQLLTVNVGVVALAGDFGLRGAAVAAASMVTGLLFSRWWLRREVALLGATAPPKAFRTPRPLGLLAGLAAFAVLGIGVSYFLKGVRYVVLPISLAQLRWSDFFGISPRAVGVVFAAGGIAMVMLGAFVYRGARALGRARVREVLQKDPRPPVLYLRSFADDALPLPTIASARRPLFELFSLRGADPFEEPVAWELDSYGPVVAVGRPGRSLASLGAAREHLPHDGWRDQIAQRMDDAAVIAISPGETEGVVWELRQIVAGGHLERTVFVFPPLAPSALARRWEHTAAVLRGAGAAVDPLPVSVARVHTVRIAAAGDLSVTGASIRDEATYRTAIDRSLERLPARDGSVAMPAPVVV